MRQSPHPTRRQATRYRNRVLGFLSVLFVITYLDRICLSVAGPRMQADLHISPVGWGWVTGIFSFSYAIFEVPGGALADRIGSRRVLTRIVLWWSAFTSLTGAVVRFPVLLIVRFCFGAGEGGAFPSASAAIASWFPVRERARALGVILMAGQLGGALTPLLVVPIQVRYGWRASFYAFGTLGIFWSIAWHAWFRDTPAEKNGVTPAELEETRDLPAKTGHSIPWAIALRSPNLWAVMVLTACYCYPWVFFQSWFHTYLIKGRGYSEKDLYISTLPYLVGACANVGGGILSTLAVKKLGLTWGRRSCGLLGLGIATVATFIVIFTKDRTISLVALSLLYGGIALQQPSVFAVCLDIGGKFGGTVTGFMNTAGQLGAVLSSVFFGYLVSYFGNYTAPFVPMAALLIIATFLWLKVEPTHQVVSDVAAPLQPVVPMLPPF